MNADFEENFGLLSMTLQLKNAYLRILRYGIYTSEKLLSTTALLEQDKFTKKH